MFHWSTWCQWCSKFEKHTQDDGNFWKTNLPNWPTHIYKLLQFVPLVNQLYSQLYMYMGNLWLWEIDGQALQNKFWIIRRHCSWSRSKDHFQSTDLTVDESIIHPFDIVVSAKNEKGLQSTIIEQDIPMILDVDARHSLVPFKPISTLARWALVREAYATDLYKSTLDSVREAPLHNVIKRKL